MQAKGTMFRLQHIKNKCQMSVFLFVFIFLCKIFLAVTVQAVHLLVPKQSLMISTVFFQILAK